MEHLLLWIENVPVVGINCPEEVCSFIQDRMTCHIPDSDTSPDLNHLVTKYQMHKCSKYCKRNIKVGKTYVSRCRFYFARPVRGINDIENSLKSCNIIYYLKRDEKEVPSQRLQSVAVEIVACKYGLAMRRVFP